MTQTQPIYEIEVYIPILESWLPRQLMAPNLTSALEKAFEPYGPKGWVVVDWRWYGGERSEYREKQSTMEI